MLAAQLDDLVAALTAPGISDEEKVLRLASFLAAGGSAETLRGVWPVENLPVIGRYFCTGRIGQGASGTVFKAISLALPRQFVALKILRLGAEEDRQRFFHREIEILRSLNSPNVVRYLDSGTLAGSHYLAMEFVSGAPLDEYLANTATTLDEKLALFQKVCAAVEDIHRAGIIHRDLKPRHVLVRADGEPTIVDFGLSAARSMDWPTEIRRTQTELGRIMGTIKYMSPEQAWGGIYQTDFRTDIWSLGIMLYEIVTQGDYPYALGPMEGVAATDALLYRIQTEAPRRPAIGSAENAGALSTLISRCLVHEPDRRVQSAGQLADDLARIREQRRIVTRPLPLPYRLRRLAVGLAIHARFALCAASIFGVVLGLSLAAWLRFARWNVEDEFSYATRSRLAALSDSTRAPEFLMVGIGDGTVEVAPRIAASNGLEGVTSDVPTWRGLHGLLMERLAAAKPSLMVWDFYFRTPQAEDAAFVRGAESLRAAGAGVALAATGFSEQGPDLSAPLWQPLRDDAAAGLILARDMVERPGEFVIAVQRSDYTFPSLILSAFAALVHPGCTPDVDYSAQRSHLMLRYRQAGSPGMLAGVDEILLSRNFRQAFGNGTVRPGDVLACKIFPLSSLTYWTQRTVSYESLLRASKEEVCRLASGKIVCVIDTRGAAGGGKFDRHRVKYPQGIVENVPGGYLLADGLRNLIQGCGSQPAFPDVITFAVLLTTSVIGCVVGIPLARQPWVRTYRRQLLLALCLCIIGAASAALMLSLRTENTVQAAAGGAAALFAAALSLAIEGTRQQHRLPSRTAD